MRVRTLLRFRALTRAAVALLFVASLQGACIHDWDAYDPRIGDGGSGGGGTGGTGGGTGGPCTPGETAACYSGPEGTQGVGVCKAGTTTCLQDGTGFGPCEGEVTPGVEDCGPADEDCDGQVNEADAGCSCEPGTTLACYGAPSATKGVGPCQGGVQVCAPDGNGYGVCLGQVIPGVEDCSTDEDDDCDGTVNTHCALWSKRFGNSQDQYPRAIAAADDDGVIVVGDSAGTVNFGGSPLAAAGSSDVVIIKLDQNGEHVWSERFGDTAYESARAVATDPGGDIYVAGNYTGPLDFGLMPPLTNAGSSDVFVAKLDPTGKPMWAYGFGDNVAQYVNAIAADATGVIFAGSFNGTMDLGGGVVLKSASSEDGFVIKLSPDGALMWSASFGGSQIDSVHGLALDGAGDVLLTGTFDETLNLGDPPIGDIQGIDAFAAKLDGSTGAHVWSVSFGGSGDEVGEAIAADPSGNALVVGWFNADIDVGGGLTVGAGAEDAFVVKLSPTGQFLWGHTYGDATSQELRVVATDSSGNVVVGGSINGIVDFGGGGLLAAGQDDIAIVKLDPMGAHLFSRRFGDHADQDTRSIAIDSKGNILLGGDCQGTVNFGQGALFSAGSEDMCLAKLAP